jgi:peptidoglycan/xylan/chitin deacetylase (PgdA/CDA1 family)
VLKTLTDYFRIPADLPGNLLFTRGPGDTGFFRFGSEAVCYGQCESGVSARVEDSALHDASSDIRRTNSEIRLPFDPAQVIENLRRERYGTALRPQRERMVIHELILKAYYFVRELLPVSVRRHLQRAYYSDWRARPFPAWPVDFTVDTLQQEMLRLSMESSGQNRIPFIWFWPESARNCLIMTHDVETTAGRDFTPQLMDLDEAHGIKASFQVIPEKRYEVPEDYVRQIRERGFEFNLHDLNHDGHLFRQREEFLRRAARINEYVHRFEARGFRAGAMYRNLEWYDAFEFSYDMSVPNVAHLEPKRGGCCTVMPYFVGRILELPLTATQDYTLFYILNDYSIDLWKRQLALIQQKNGLMSFIAHPDYLIDRRNRKVFESLLSHLRELIDREGVWMALPGDVDEWWRARSEMRLVSQGKSWVIEGPEAERARLAYAVLDNGELKYEITGVPSGKGVRA